MGLFDYVRVAGESFRCSEGHDLSAEEFQTKDLQCIMATAHIEEDGAFRFEYGGWGPDNFPKHFFGKVNVYTTCKRCPAFVQARTLNLCDRAVEFEITVMADSVELVKRLGGSLSEWLEAEPASPWMEGCAGPMRHEQAYEIHCRRAPFPGATA